MQRTPSRGELLDVAEPGLQLRGCAPRPVRLGIHSSAETGSRTGSRSHSGGHREASRRPPPGTLGHFGPFVVLERLAIGGMAEIFRVRHPARPSQAFVLKCIRPDCEANPEYQAMLRDEAEILAQLEHPNLNQVFELAQDGTRLGLVLEYIDGVDVGRLRRSLQSEGHTLPISLVLYILQNVLRGLHYAHRARDGHGRRLYVVHRDVSPGNIMVDTEGRVKLIDFGIAQAQRRQARTEVGNVKGKFRYMAPEQIRGDEPGPAADIYASAILLWELLAGVRIYDNCNMPQVMLHVAGAEVPPLHEARAHLPIALERAYQKATALDPADRFETAQAFADALLGIVPAADLAVARVSLAAQVRRVRQQESQEKLDRAVARARAAAVEHDLEEAILCALETPDRVEPVEPVRAVPIAPAAALLTDPTESFEPGVEPPTAPMDPIAPSPPVATWVQRSPSRHRMPSDLAAV